MHRKAISPIILRPRVARGLHLRFPENLHFTAENLVDGDTVVTLLDDLFSLGYLRTFESRLC
jgi:hypothetical protein